MYGNVLSSDAGKPQANDAQLFLTERWRLASGQRKLRHSCDVRYP